MSTWQQCIVDRLLRQHRTQPALSILGCVTGFLFTLLSAARIVAAQEPDAPLFVEIACSEPNPYVEEALHLVFRVGIQVTEAGEEWVQPFTRLLDVPIALEAPWYENPTRFAWLREAEANDSTVRLALNGEPFAVRRLGVEARGGRRYEMFEWQRRAAILEAGVFAWPAMEARAVQAKFGPKDFLGQAEVLERREIRAASRPEEFVVRALPLDQRPAAFQNAVGSFKIEATIDNQDLQKGAPLRLVLHVRGEGNLERLRLPSLRDLAPFHLLGARDELRAQERVAIFDLMPKRGGALTLGPIEVPYFDPRPPGTYRIAETPKWTIHVAGNAEDAQHPDASAPNGASTPPWVWWLATVASATGLTLLVGRWLRRRAKVDPPPLRLAEQLTRRIEKEGADPGAALSEVIARVLHRSPETLLSSDLEQRLEEAGASTEIAFRLSQALRQSVAQRYGSRAAAPSYMAWVPWLEEWEQSASSAREVGRPRTKK